MADFTRLVPPRKVTYPIMQAGLDSWGQTGKGQFRTTNQTGREWKETYPPMRGGDETVRAFLSYINNLWRNRTIFTITHKHLSVFNGTVTGNVYAKTSGSTGDTLQISNTTGTQTAVTGIWRQGDVITIDGINLVFDIKEVATNATQLKINPPIVTGLTITNNAVIKYLSGQVKFQCVIDEGLSMPESEEDGVYYGLVIPFRETL